MINTRKLGFHKPITTTVRWQKNSKQNPPLIRWWILSLWRGRVVLGLWEIRRGRPRLGPRARLDTRPSWPKIGGAAPCRGHTAWSTRLLDLGPEPNRRRRRPLSNEYLYASFRRRMMELSPKPCVSVGWIWDGRSNWVGDEIQHGKGRGVCVFNMVMFSSSPLLESELSSTHSHHQSPAKG
jgi:hypothetical protein